MQVYLALIYKLRLESYWWQNTFGFQRLFFSKCEKWSIFEWCTCRAQSTFMMVKGCISSPIQPSILARVTKYNHTELKFLFKLVVSAFGNHTPPLTLPKKIDFEKKKEKKAWSCWWSAYLYPNRPFTQQLVNPALTLVLCVIYTGGLGFSTDQIGTALLCVAGPMLVLQLWLYPKVNVQALVIWRMDNAIHWVNPYPVDSSTGSVVNSYVLNSISIFWKTGQKCLFITVIGYTHELLHMCIDLLFFLTSSF